MPEDDIRPLSRARDAMIRLSYLHCMECGKQVSTGFIPMPTDTPDREIIVRAILMCPECFDANFEDKR